MEYHKYSAIELKNLFLEGKASAEQITNHFLSRIESLDKQIGAFLHVFKERAINQAKAVDKKRKEGKPLGKLAAIPIAFKDNIHVKDELTTCASKFLTNFNAPFASTVQNLIEAEDGIIIGKTNLDEFAMGSSTEHSALQQTKNPWNLSCVPGGSSGGSAAAVAARLVPLALGSDTGGSIRQPAAFCGVSGFKPTYGRVSRYGLVAFGSSLDQIGPFANHIEDIALLMEVIGTHCSKDSTSISLKPETFHPIKDLNGKKIGVPQSFLKDLSPEVKQNFNDAIEALKKQGAEIIDVDLSILKYSIAVYYILATAEASTNLARFDGIRYGVRSPHAKTLSEVYELSKEEGFGQEVKRRILLGTYVLSSGYQDAYYRKAQKVRSLFIKRFNEVFSSCDIIATPVSPFPAFEIGAIKDPLQMYLADTYTICANLAGLPAISVPCGFTKEKLPLGLQLIGPQLSDQKVLNVADVYEKNTHYNKDIPSLL